MDFTDLLGRDDLNAENKHLRRSIYIGFSNSGSPDKLDTNLSNFVQKLNKHLKKNFLPHDFESDVLYSLFKEDEIPSKLQEVEEEYDNYLELVYYKNQRPSLWPPDKMTIAKKFEQRERPIYQKDFYEEPKKDKRTHYYYPESSSSSPTLDLEKKKTRCYSDSSSSSWEYSPPSTPPLQAVLRELRDDPDFWDDSYLEPSTSKKTGGSDLADLGGGDTAPAPLIDPAWDMKCKALNSLNEEFWKSQTKSAEMKVLCNRLIESLASRSSSPLFQPYRKTKKKTLEDEFNELIYPPTENKEMLDKSESSSPSINTSTSDSDLGGGDIAQVAGRDYDNILDNSSKVDKIPSKLESVDKEDLELVCSSRRSSPSRSFSIADKSKRKRSRQVKKKKMLGYLHRSILCRKMPDKEIPFFIKQDWDSSGSYRVKLERRARRRNSSNPKPRYLSQSITFCKLLQDCGEWFSSSSSSGLDLSDTERVARAREYNMPTYACVNVLIFVNKSVCKKLAKYLGLIYIEDLLAEAKVDMFKFNGSRRNLKYCRYIQPYINKKLLSGSHDICLTHTLYLWETIYAQYKGVISESDDKELYLEAKKDTNFYVELGEAPHFLQYLEAVTLIICGILRGPYYRNVKYRCEDFGENAYYPLKLSLIAIIPFYILLKVARPFSYDKIHSNYFSMICRREEGHSGNILKKHINI